MSLEDANHLKCIQTNIELFKLQILTLKECLSGLFKNFEDVQKEKEKTKEKVIMISKEAEEVIQQSMFGQNMVENLINDLMDISKLQKGVFKFDNQFFSLP
jgi:predicted transcriptional regulator